jgi:integrase
MQVKATNVFPNVFPTTNNQYKNIMAIIKIILRTERVNGKNEHPLRLRITKDRKSKSFNLGIHLLAEQWDEEKQRAKKNHPNATKINAYLAQKVAEAEGVTVELETQSKYIGTSRIKETIMGNSAIEFFPYAERFANSFYASGKIGSYKRAKSVIQKLNKYVRGKKICFDIFTVSFLKEYEYYLTSELKNRTNTVHANFRLIRTIINNAIREDVVPAELNPFNKMKLKLEQTTREFLTEDELHKIESLSLQKNYMINHHRNMYVFSSYAGGLRISDVLQLRWKNFDGEKIFIKIRKTQTPLSISLPSKAIEVINSYKKEKGSDSDFIFPILKISPDEKDATIIHTAISRATAYTNKDIKKLASLCDIDKHLSFHTSRHTWATRALTKGMRIEHVSKLMGHAAIKETQVYAKIINSELDKAMALFG